MELETDLLKKILKINSVVILCCIVSRLAFREMISARLLGGVLAFCLSLAVILELWVRLKK